MNIDKCDDLSRCFVECYLFQTEEALKKLEEESKNCAHNFLLRKSRLSVILEQFNKQKENLIQFCKEIGNSTRKNQAKFIKTNYGTKNIKSKICFRLIDSQSLKLEKQEEIDLFIFIGKSIDID